MFHYLRYELNESLVRTTRPARMPATVSVPSRMGVVRQAAPYAIAGVWRANLQPSVPWQHWFPEVLPCEFVFSQRFWTLFWYKWNILFLKKRSIFNVVFCFAFWIMFVYQLRKLFPCFDHVFCEELQFALSISYFASCIYLYAPRCTFFTLHFRRCQPQ